MNEKCELHDKAWDDPSHECFTLTDTECRLVLTHYEDGWWVMDQYGSFYEGPYRSNIEAERRRLYLNVDLETCSIEHTIESIYPGWSK